MITSSLTFRLAAAVSASCITLAIFTAVVSGPQREVLLAGARPAAVTARAGVSPDTRVVLADAPARVVAQVEK